MTTVIIIFYTVIVQINMTTQLLFRCSYVSCIIAMERHSKRRRLRRATVAPGTAVLEFGSLSTFLSQPDSSIGITVRGAITTGSA